MIAGGGNQLISVHPDELKFIFELDKESFCDLKVVNNTEHHVAFKVKATSPKKYFAKPKSGVIQAWDSCVIRVTLQAQREYPPNMQCKDKFLLQSTTVPPHTDVDELLLDTFNKDNSGKTLEECKLRVVYASPSSAQGNSEQEALRTRSPDDNSSLQLVKDERDAAVRQTQQLQQEMVQSLQRVKDERDAAVRQTQQLQQELVQSLQRVKDEWDAAVRQTQQLQQELLQSLQRIKDERDAAVRQAQQLQQELDVLRR